MTLKASISAIHADADKWDSIASTLKKAMFAAMGNDLGESALSFISRTTGLLDTYQDLQVEAVQILKEGVVQLEALASVLHNVGYAYENSDEKASSEHKGVWEPHRE